MDTAQTKFPAIHELCSHPAIGQFAAAITGASMIQTFVTQQLIKPPGGLETANVGWHQDYQYWQGHVRGEVFTAWVAISDVTEESGPMRFVVGSHKWGLLNAGDFFSGNLDSLRDRIRAAHPGAKWEEASAVLKPGAVSFHHRLTIHGSGANRTTWPRKSVAIHLRTERSALAPGIKYRDVGWLNDFADERACPVMYGELQIAAPGSVPA
jgi:ectoine hydroxylase-related dioxygenase (phytanoyl-CoA dioxygenase family)